MTMTHAQLRRLGRAVATVENAVDGHADVLRQHPGGNMAAVGDALQMALALNGFVVVDDPDMAKIECKRMEREATPS